MFFKNFGESITFFIGPQASLLMGAKYTSESSTSVGGTTTTETSTLDGDDAKDGLSGVTIDGVVGAQINLASGLNVGLRYGMGLTPVNDEFTDIAKSKFGVAALSVGFTL